MGGIIGLVIAVALRFFGIIDNTVLGWLLLIDFGISIVYLFLNEEIGLAIFFAIAALLAYFFLIRSPSHKQTAVVPARTAQQMQTTNYGDAQQANGKIVYIRGKPVRVSADTSPSTPPSTPANNEAPAQNGIIIPKIKLGN